MTGINKKNKIRKGGNKKTSHKRNNKSDNEYVIISCNHILIVSDINIYIHTLL